MAAEHPADVEGRRSLEAFDREMAIYDTAVEVAVRTENKHLDATGMPSLREDSKRQRRWLILSSVALLLALVFEIRPTTVAALGLGLSGAKAQVVIAGIAAFAIFFLIEFAVFARRDCMLWQQRVAITHRRLIAALERQRGRTEVTFASNGRLQALLADVDQVVERWKNRSIGDGQQHWFKAAMSTTTGWVEIVLPTLVALFTLLACGLRVAI